MSRALIVFGSTYGQTERIAERIAGTLRDAGFEVDVHRGDRLPTPLSVGAYDGVVVAASVLMGRYQRYIREFVRLHADRLNHSTSVFVSVCGAAGSDPRRAQEYMDALFHESGWHPTITRSFTGAVAYTRYSWLLRWWLKRINRRAGLPTDTSRDWDFTDWGEVDHFARGLATSFAPADTVGAGRA
jgi:menaquinone-dependent protoporphyrinogen oxidase